jgi:hypothetical protein
MQKEEGMVRNWIGLDRALFRDAEAKEKGRDSSGFG